MWDNVTLLRNTANALIAFSVLAGLYGVAYYIIHLPALFPVRAVHLNAAPHRVDARQALVVAREELRGNLLTADIEGLRESLERLPWVRSASIRRKFPHTLVVHLEEHHAVARWNDSGLVNQEGEVFAAQSEQVLPRFVGQDGRAAEILQHHGQFNSQLEVLGLSVVQLVLSPRHAWQLRLSNGIFLELGREEVERRLARFVAAQMTDTTGRLPAGRTRVTYVDLRYRNGFAVRQFSDVRG